MNLEWSEVEYLRILVFRNEALWRWEPLTRRRSIAFRDTWVHGYAVLTQLEDILENFKFIIAVTVHRIQPGRHFPIFRKNDLPSTLRWK